MITSIQDIESLQGIMQDYINEKDETRKLDFKEEGEDFLDAFGKGYGHVAGDLTTGDGLKTFKKFLFMFGGEQDAEGKRVLTEIGKRAEQHLRAILEEQKENNPSMNEQYKDLINKNNDIRQEISKNDKGMEFLDDLAKQDAAKAEQYRAGIKITQQLIAQKNKKLKKQIKQNEQKMKNIRNSLEKMFRELVRSKVF